MADQGKRKKRGKKAIIVAISIVAFLPLSYFGGGYVAGLIAVENVFGHRYDEGDAKRFDETVLLMRKDYPLLNSREEVSFLSGENTLKGHIYFAPFPKGTILFAHGIYGHRDDNMASMQEYFLSRGYSVFALDMTASSTSEGKGIPGLHQSRLDVEAALAYLSTRSDIDKDRVGLVGYSWGAYGVSSVMSSSLPLIPKAVISFAAFDSPMEEMMFMAKSHAGDILELTRPQLEWAMATRGGPTWNARAILGMEKRPEARWFLIQGDEDATVPYGNSLYEEALSRAKTFESILKRGYGHLGLWRTQAALDAYKGAKAYFESVASSPDAYGLLASYVESKGGKQAFSSLDLDLMERLEKGLASAFAS